MTTDKKRLTALRREIDRIDDDLLDLLTRRADVVRKVGAVKGATDVFLRPDREAVILRRLLARARDGFPRDVLVRVWREIMSALVRVQGPFTMAVFMPRRGAGYLEVARDQYGAYSPARTFASAAQVIQAVDEGTATVGILPMPEYDEEQPWWPNLLSKQGPRIIARLPPFCGPGPGRGDGLEALAVARLSVDPTGEDRSLLAVECTAPMSRAHFRAVMEQGGFDVGELLGFVSMGEDVLVHLVEVEGHVAPGDSRLSALTGEESPARVAVAHVRVLGGYAKPLDADALAGSGGTGERRTG